MRRRRKYIYNVACAAAGLRHRVGGARFSGAVRRVREPRGHRGRERAEPQGVRGPSRRLDAPVLVLGDDDEERWQRGAQDGGGGAPPVRRHPRAHGGPRHAGLRAVRQDLHGRVAQGDDAARRARAARASHHRHLLRRPDARRAPRRRTGFWRAGMNNPR
jgi:hypothetical protein